MSTQKGTTPRFPTMKLPKPIVSIQNAVDAIERAKKKRAALKEEIDKHNANLITLCRRHAKKLAKMKINGEDAILYRMCGYRVLVSKQDKVDATIEKES